MLVPLVILAIASAFAGIALGPAKVVEHFLAATPSLAAFANHSGEAQVSHGFHFVPWLSTALTVCGIAWAALLVLGPLAVVRPVISVMKAVALYSLSFHKFFVDEIYSWIIVRPLTWIASLAGWIDRYFIDLLVDAIGFLPKLVGSLLRSSHNGWIPWYGLGFVLGILVLLAAMFF
jgi:NADH-quinone oxidoreductase subunit L